MNHSRARAPSCAALRSVVVGSLVAPTMCIAQVVTIFGLPLGGAVPKLSSCRAPYPAPVPALCWSESPKAVATRYQVGSVQVPASLAPLWAELASLSVTISHGLIYSIKLQVPYDQAGPANLSLTKRFSYPTSHYAQGGNINDKWDDLGALAIDLFCVRDERCTVTFRSAAAIAEDRASKANTARRDATRPATP